MGGARAAITLRTEGFDGRIVLLGAEADAPYERPPLSKAFLRGEQERRPSTSHRRVASWADIEVELRLGTEVSEFDPGSSTLTLGSGERMPYDRLLLATGSEPRRLDVPGADLDGVHVLRTVEDSERIGAAIARGGPIVVIGGGWIGAEVAACARQRGAQVTLLTGTSPLFERTLGSEVAAVYAELHRRHGLDLRQGGQATAIEGDAGRVRGVRLADGTFVAADAVVVGIGAVPRTGLAERAGLEVSGGVRVDALFRTSGARGVGGRGYRADASSHPRPGCPPRPLGRSLVRRSGRGAVDARAAMRLTSGSRTSTATSTTCRWRHGACHPAGTGWSSEASRSAARSWRSGCSTDASWGRCSVARVTRPSARRSRRSSDRAAAVAPAALADPDIVIGSLVPSIPEGT